MTPVATFRYYCTVVPSVKRHPALGPTCIHPTVLIPICCSDSFHNGCILVKLIGGNRTAQGLIYWKDCPLIRGSSSCRYHGIFDSESTRLISFTHTKIKVLVCFLLNVIVNPLSAGVNDTGAGVTADITCPCACWWDHTCARPHDEASEETQGQATARSSGAF